jgi:hypothetical protein
MTKGLYMPWYAVSYDLRKEYSPEAWQRVGDALRTALDWCTPLYSFWIVQSSLPPSTIISILLNSGAIDDNDGVIVLEITGKGNYRRVTDQVAADWLNGHLTFA